MTVLETGISWTDSTWNPTTGCTKVSAGCQFCYAEALTNRLWGGNFEQVRTHAGRLGDVRKFLPLESGARGGTRRPRRVFVNSMSDLMHKDIPDSFRDNVFDAMATMPDTIFQILTKRPMTLRRYIERRFAGRAVPDNLWLGVSVEDNAVADRIGFLRAMKDRLGDFTAFLSVEPLIGPCDRHDYTGIDQVLIGGESGPNARDMLIEWPRTSRDLARRAGAAVWFKQFGTWRNNPLYASSNAPTHFGRIRSAIERGERAVRIEIVNGREKIIGEKGGATLDGELIHEHPPAFRMIERRLNPRLL